MEFRKTKSGFGFSTLKNQTMDLGFPYLPPLTVREATLRHASRWVIGKIAGAAVDGGGAQYFR